MGGPNKLLLLVDGRPVVRRAVEAALAAGLDPVIVVTGGNQPAGVLAALEGLPVRLVHNPDADLGMSTSIAAGVRAVGAVDGVAIVLGDMPWVAAADLRALHDAFARHPTRAICVPVAAGRRGNPVIWPSRCFDDLLRLTGDTGARGLLERFSDAVCEVVVEGSGVLRDVDVPEDLVGPSP
jgi:molybdenum cofactor cytidylyltransferase